MGLKQSSVLGRVRKPGEAEQSEWPSSQNSARGKNKDQNLVTVYTRDEAYLVETSMYELNSFNSQR